LKSEAICIEQLNRLEFSVINGYIVFANTNIQYKLQPIVCVKLGEEQFAEKDDKQLMARLAFKRAVTKIIVKLQAYKFNQYILRTQACRQQIKKVLPNMPEYHREEEEEEIEFGEDYYSENAADSDEDEQEDPYLEAERLGRLHSKSQRKKRTEYMHHGRSPRKVEDTYNSKRPGSRTNSNNDELASSSLSESINSKKDAMFEEEQSLEDEQWEEYRDHPQPVQIPQTFVYDIILKNVYKDKHTALEWPVTLRERIKYVILFPHNAMQWFIPNPMKEGNEQYYPLTLFMATLYVWFYTYLIVWWTYMVTISYDLHFSILPMIIYPFGIVLRDLKKLDDMRICVSVFKQHCPQQRMGLAETFSGPVFQITGLMGFAWTMYIATTNQSISFINEGI
jgi:hypothetical protein